MVEISPQQLRRRHRAEKRFRCYGLIALAIASTFLILLIGNIGLKAYKTFYTYQVQLSIAFPLTDDTSAKFNPRTVLLQGLAATFPQYNNPKDLQKLYSLISDRGSRTIVTNYQKDHPEIIGETATLWLPISSAAEQILKSAIRRDLPENERKLSDLALQSLDQLRADGKVRLVPNWQFLTGADSSEPEVAGIWGAVVGSFYTMIITLLIAFPLGVCTAIYLEEFAPENPLTDWIEININNLAAIPSIIFGLLGLAIFIQLFGLPRSAPLVGGMVLALMTLPTIIITTRVSLKTVPVSIRQAALSIGASPLQTVFHHVLPLAMPGVLTGAIIGMGRALGETAPLLMIGMVAFVANIPDGFLDNATVLPVQIYLWSDKPERGFVEKTAAAIILLLVFLIIMNATAVYLRKKFERKW